MPGFGGTLEARQIQDVIAYVRSLQQTALLARDAPGPEDCTVAPRTLDEIAALSEGRGPAEPPNATETAACPPMRRNERRGHRRRREMVACSNAGDILRRLALYSDDRLRFAYPEGPTQALRGDRGNAIATGAVRERRIARRRGCRDLEDGRVSARVSVDNPAMHSHDPAVAAQAAQQEAARLIFVEEDGHGGSMRPEGRRHPKPRRSPSASGG